MEIDRGMELGWRKRQHGAGYILLIATLVVEAPDAGSSWIPSVPS